MFESLLKKAHLSKRELARQLGLNQNTPTNWRGEAPEYALAYLRLLIKYNRIAG